MVTIDRPAIAARNRSAPGLAVDRDAHDYGHSVTSVTFCITAGVTMIASALRPRVLPPRLRPTVRTLFQPIGARAPEFSLVTVGRAALQRWVQMRWLRQADCAVFITTASFYSSPDFIEFAFWTPRDRICDPAVDV